MKLFLAVFLAAIFVIGASLATTYTIPLTGTGVSASGAGPMVGISMYPPNNPPAHQWLGRYYDFTSDNADWGVGGDGNPYCQSGNYPIAASIDNFDQGRGSVTDPNIAYNGGYNGVYDTMASGVAPCANTVYALRLDHEWYGNWYGWSPYYHGGYRSPSISATTWIGAWRNIVTRFRANASTRNLKFAWDFPETATCYWGSQQQYYPGDAYVDIISTDQYFQQSTDGNSSSASWNNRLNNTAGCSLTAWASFAAAHNKPMAVWEWCETYHDGYDVTQFSNWMKSHNVIAHSWWDEQNIPACLFQNYPNTQNAYIAEWQPPYQPSYAFWGGMIPLPTSKPGGF